MSTFSNGQDRHAKGEAKSVGGRFRAMTHAENPGVSLTDAADSAAVRREKQVEDLSELADTIVAGKVFVHDDVAAAHEVVPNVPENMLSDEMWHNVLAATLHRDGAARAKAIDALVDLDAREARWRSDPTFTPPTGEATETGGNGPVCYTTVVGGKYTGYRDVADVAKDVRGDLKVAVQAGYLPDGLTFRVTTSKYSGGQSMTVDVRGLPDEDIYDQDPVSGEPGLRYSLAARELRTRVSAIAGAYTRDTTDIQTDYFNVMYYSFVELEDEERADRRTKESARLKANRERNAAA